ncbi:unnamed protein product [Bursaphelenchus okinawaensis]|uniref:Uncharacterized protein n=1 Tax=Bursaphelenchus okinawaensis TaxID=465554 RepID=A0A811KGK6_9BILA|nr:unnamed protein product [Bursaphelenchus okinawaensis]CAG9104059.1 unnamed protein product [Bursaphelenchus okinawaensis]
MTGVKGPRARHLLVVLPSSTPILIPGPALLLLRTSKVLEEVLKRLHRPDIRIMSKVAAVPGLMMASSKVLWSVFGFVLLVQIIEATVAQAQIDVNCGRILANNNLDAEDKQLLCKIYQQSSALEQLGAIVSDSLERFMGEEGSATEEEARPKRKHEYLRFGKRKHEYLRFGKRKHEYLRFGRK